MLSFKLTGDILEVKETILYFTKDKVSYWYYDIVKWEKSSKGDKDEVPNRKCSPEDIEWVTKYYLPKLLTAN